MAVDINLLFNLGIPNQTLDEMLNRLANMLADRESSPGFWQRVRNRFKAELEKEDFPERIPFPLPPDLEGQAMRLFNEQKRALQNAKNFERNPVPVIKSALQKLGQTDFGTLTSEQTQTYIDTLKYIKDLAIRTDPKSKVLFDEARDILLKNTDIDWGRIGVNPIHLSNAIVSGDLGGADNLINGIARALTNIQIGKRTRYNDTEWDRRFEEIKQHLNNVKNSILNTVNIRKEELGGLVKETENLEKTFTGVFTTKKDLETKQAAVSGFISGLPSELKSIRDPFVEGLRQQALRQFGEFIPRAEEQLAARGRLFGGGLPAVLGETAVGLAETLQQAQTELESEDNQFVFNATFQNMMDELLRSQLGVEQFMAGQRSSILKKQGLAFEKQQTLLNTALKEFLSAERLERGLRERRAGLEARRREREVAGQEQLFQNIVQPFFQAGGTAIGSRIG